MRNGGKVKGCKLSLRNIYFLYDLECVGKLVEARFAGRDDLNKWTLFIIVNSKALGDRERKKIVLMIIIKLVMQKNKL